MTDRNYDPELAPLVPLLPKLGIEDVAKARANLVELLGAMPRTDPPEHVAWEDRLVPGPAGDPEIRVRVYRPKSGDGRPGVLYIHGGGFCVGSIDAEHEGALRVCADLEAVVVSVGYRLAPEHPFPAGFEDCYAGLLWVAENFDALGVDPSRVAVMGGSAGGALAAAVALAARDRKGPRLCFQLLNIPVIDDRLETVSMQQFTDTPMWNRPNAALSWRYYLGENPGDVSPYAAPGRATDLSGLPPAFVSTMEFDPLRDEGIQYAQRLLQAGVSVELHQYPGTFHGSAVIQTAAVSQRAGGEMTAVLARAFGLST
ncbi:MAG: alpha/beta hydrolase [Candidatus Binatia bacterium]|nr:alpha/beta hydrolase [Candidatus Binatia bacterium]